MGKYSIGARVRYVDEEGTVIEKRKGERRVRFDFQDMAGEGSWWRKDELEPVASATVTVGVRPEKVANEFSIEVGKSYRTRDGRKVGPMKYDSGQLVGNGVNTVVYGGMRRSEFLQRYLRDGSVYQLRSGEEQDHLVAEWAEPAPVAADIQVGDKIDYWLDGKKQVNWAGSVITNMPGEFGMYYARHPVGGLGGFFTSMFRPSPVRAGDRVRYVNGGDFVAKRLLGLKGFVRSVSDDTSYVVFDSGEYHTCLTENLRAIGDASVAFAKAA